MNQVGDGESQPTEGVGTLDDIVDAMVGGEPAPVESDESEDSDEAEAVEAEEEGADDADEEEQEEPSFTIKHDGKEVTLKQSELVEMAQQGFDYTRKTMALAEERKAVEPLRQQAEQFRKQSEEIHAEAVNRLTAYTQFLESQVGAPPPIEWAQQDAAYYLAQKEQHEARKGQLHQAYAEIQRLNDEQARQRQAWIAERAESAEKVLRDTLPGWNDDMAHELAGYARTLGLTPQTTTEALLEPGFWQLVHKAKAFDAIQAQKAQMKPKAALARVDKPKASNPTGKTAERAKREAAFNKAPSVDALADLLR